MQTPHASVRRPACRPRSPHMTTQFANLAAANASFYATQLCAIHTAQSLAERLQGNARGAAPCASSAAALLARGASYRAVGRVLSCTAGH